MLRHSSTHTPTRAATPLTGGPSGPEPSPSDQPEEPATRRSLTFPSTETGMNPGSGAVGVLSRHGSHPQAVPRSPAEVAEALRDASYLADDSTALIAFLAQRLGKPVLVRRPGRGQKTKLAKALSRATGRELVRLQCYEGLDEAKAPTSGTTAKQLLQIQPPSTQDEGATPVGMGEIFTEDFLLERPLMKAIANPDPVVPLIDEIDKTDQEFEAMLLELLSDFQITIPEMGQISATTHPDRAADFEQFARADRGPETALPLPLARLSGPGSGDRDHPASRAGNRRGPWPAGWLTWSTWCASWI